MFQIHGSHIIIIIQSVYVSNAVRSTVQPLGNSATRQATAMNLCVYSARTTYALHCTVHKFYNVMFSVVCIFFTGFNKLSLFHRNDAFHHFTISLLLLLFEYIFLFTLLLLLLLFWSLYLPIRSNWVDLSGVQFSWECWVWQSTRAHNTTTIWSEEKPELSRFLHFSSLPLLLLHIITLNSFVVFTSLCTDCSEVISYVSYA